MFQKLLLVIIVSGVTGAALLANRQRQIDTVHTMSKVHERLMEHERRQWTLQHEVVDLCRPAVVRVALGAMEQPIVPIESVPSPTPDPETRFAAERDDDLDDDLGG